MKVPAEIKQAIRTATNHFKKAHKASEKARIWLEQNNIMGDTAPANGIEDFYIDTVEMGAGDTEELIRMIKHCGEQ